MAYIDQTYYETEYKGSAIPAESFFSLAERASDQIDTLTSYALKTSAPFEKLHPFLQGQVKKATAAQTEFLFLQGGETAVHGGFASSGSLGSFSYSESPGSEKQTVSPAVISYLAPTGLLYRGIRSC